MAKIIEVNLCYRPFVRLSTLGLVKPDLHEGASAHLLRTLEMPSAAYDQTPV